MAKKNSLPRFNLTLVLSLILILLIGIVTFILFGNQIKRFIQVKQSQIKSSIRLAKQRQFQKVEFVAVDSIKLLEERNLPKDFEYLKTQEWDDLSCIDRDKAGDFFNYKRIQSKLTDPVLVDGLKGLDSTTDKNILLEGVCKSEDQYLVLFTTTEVELGYFTFIQKAEAGGGGYWGPQHLAIISNNSTKVMKNIQTNHHMAYWSCTHIMGTTEDDLYIGCGGGDGAAAARSILKMDINGENKEELFYCDILIDHETCIDAKGKTIVDRIIPYEPT